jgi:NAD(P)-dependent dehydrogenase (short-subunit alcohol dehydrogenase family)
MINKSQKTVIITGGAGRVGLALTKDLIKKGHQVLIGDINKTHLIKIKKKINSNNLIIFSGNLTNKKNINKFIEFGLKKFTKIDVAVHCAYPKSKKWGAKLEDINEKSLKEDLTSQLGGTIIFSQCILKYFLKIKRGNLILISSIFGTQTPKFENYKNLKMITPIEYSAIKSGIISITKYLAKYYQKKNIRVNCVSPGGIKDNQPALFIKRYKQYCNSKGMLDGSDISNLIIFLISDSSKYINGQNLIIDDGWTL